MPHTSHCGQSAGTSSDASALHAPSQEVSQQNGSSAHTATWHARSSQPIVPLSAQQLPAHPPQSASQVTQSSDPLQVPSPHCVPQSSGHVTVDSPSPQKWLPHTSHCGQSAGTSFDASSLHAPSQEVSQQNGSRAHTAA